MDWILINIVQKTNQNFFVYLFAIYQPLIENSILFLLKLLYSITQPMKKTLVKKSVHLKNLNFKEYR